MSMFAIFVKIIFIFCCKIFNIHITYVCNFLLTLFNLVRVTDLLYVTFETIILELLTVLHL